MILTHYIKDLIVYVYGLFSYRFYCFDYIMSFWDVFALGIFISLFALLMFRKQEVAMVFEFISEWENFNLQQLACMAYNLGLLYFMWDVAKFIIINMVPKLRRRKF